MRNHYEINQTGSDRTGSNRFKVLVLSALCMGVFGCQGLDFGAHDLAYMDGNGGRVLQVLSFHDNAVQCGLQAIGKRSDITDTPRKRRIQKRCKHKYPHSFFERSKCVHAYPEIREADTEAETRYKCIKRSEYEVYYTPQVEWKLVDQTGHEQGRWASQSTCSAANSSAHQRALENCGFSDETCRKDAQDGELYECVRVPKGRA